MKNPFKSLFTQCARPEGFWGRQMLRFMNWCHAPLTNWGLSFVDFREGWTMLDSGCGPYYRYHHGEHILTPRQQEDIMNILARFGSTDGLTFDHYVTDFDFG